MTSSEMTIFIALGYLTGKHFIADFVLQSSYQFANKSRYGHSGGLLHAAIHGALSLPLFLLFPNMAFSLFALIICGEMVAHYHIDWGKEQLLQRTGWTTRDAWFWRLFGFDQLLHLLSYLVMVAVIVSYDPGA